MEDIVTNAGMTTVKSIFARDTSIREVIPGIGQLHKNSRIDKSCCRKQARNVKDADGMRFQKYLKYITKTAIETIMSYRTLNCCAQIVIRSIILLKKREDLIGYLKADKSLSIPC